MKLNTLGAGKYLLKTHKAYIVAKRFGSYYVYKHAEFIMQCSTQRQARNIIRSHAATGVATTDGRE